MPFPSLKLHGVILNPTKAFRPSGNTAQVDHMTVDLNKGMPCTPLYHRLCASSACCSICLAAEQLLQPVRQKLLKRPSARRGEEVVSFIHGED